MAMAAADEGKCTEAELEQIMAKPEYANRVAVRAYQDGDEFVAQWDGQLVCSGNPFGLDSKLNDAGAPQPHNVFLMVGPVPDDWGWVRHG